MTACGSYSSNTNSDDPSWALVTSRQVTRVTSGHYRFCIRPTGLGHWLDYTWAKFDYTVAKLNYTLAMSDYTLAKFNYTLAKSDYTLAKSDHTLAKFNYKSDFAGQKDCAGEGFEPQDLRRQLTKLAVVVDKQALLTIALTSLGHVSLPPTTTIAVCPPWVVSAKRCAPLRN